MLRKILAVMALCSALTATAQTGTYQQRAQAYVDQYKDLAMAEQQRSGIPAAITLGQGILETEAGNSELATKANNHFGIKCKKEWKGETFAHTDDAKDECFRKYSCANDSYKDHSDYLRNSPRYTPCFQQKLTDYNAWATNLRRCGYATNPRYAQQLVQIIEDFHLQDYTLAAMQGAATVTPATVKQPATAAKTIETEPQPKLVTSPGEVVPEKDALEYKVDKGSNGQSATTLAPATETVPADDPVVYGQIVRKNGLKGFYAHKGDVLLESAVRYHQRYAHLLELNDLPDAPLAADQFIYLEKKGSKGQHSTHVVQPGETMAQIAQAEGIQLHELRNLNQLENGEEPTVGTTLELQHYAAAKPHIAAIHATEEAPTAVHPTPATTAGNYVPVAHTTTQPAPQEVPAASAQQAAITQVATQPVTPATQDAATEKSSVNIANETAVEEEPATAPVTKKLEPQDDFSKLKARLDKVVYSKPAPQAIAPAATTTAPTIKPAPAATPPPPATIGEQWYTVAKGDTAFSITKKHNITMKQLQAYNHLEGFEALHIGQKLRVH